MVLDIYRRHIISLDATKPTNVGLYIVVINLEATVIVEHDLW